MEVSRCPHAWRQQTVDIFGRRTPVARWVCERCDDATDSDPDATTGAPWDRRSAVTFRGSGSWSLRSGDAGVLDAVVYLRDACALPVGTSPLDPPPLLTPPSPWPWSFDHVTRERAGRQWSGWWRDLVGVDRSTAVTATPDPAALPAPVPGPELDAAVHGLWPLACAVTRQRDPGVHRSPIGHELLAQVVDDVGFDHDVPPGALHGRVMVLDVRGSWWAITSPGSALASPGALADPRTAHALLRAVFESGLG